jgi:hypothetical protein
MPAPAAFCYRYFLQPFKPDCLLTHKFKIMAITSKRLKRELCFGALNSESIAWKVAEQAYGGGVPSLH